MAAPGAAALTDGGELAASLWMVPWPAQLDRLLGREDKAKKKPTKEMPK